MQKDLQHHGRRPRCLKTFDRDKSVLLCSSCSKSLAPGPLFSPGGGYRNLISLNRGHPGNPQLERSVAIPGHMVTNPAK